MTNKTIPATEAKTLFAKLIDDARLEPVTVTRNRRAVAVVLSPEEYQRLEALDDAYWGERTAAAEREGSLGPKHSAAFIEAALHAAD